MKHWVSWKRAWSRRQQAARRQIEIAIKLFYEREFECAITLASAAEGQMEESDVVHLLPVLKKRRPPQFEDESKWVTFLNETRNWLKHGTPELGDTRAIAEFEAWVMLVRASTKYYAVYLEENETINGFEEWGRARGLTAKV